MVAVIPELSHLFLPHYSRAEYGTPLTLRIPNPAPKQKILKSYLMIGDYTGVVPPDPIPNSEVKYVKADDSPSGESR